MRITVTNYLDVISSWCNWAAPMWTELQERYRNRVAFTWKIALMDETGMPQSHAQMDWYYRRSGMLMGSSYMLNSAWHTPGTNEYIAPNAIAEAARDLGVGDDRVWTALGAAGLREGKKTGDWNVAAEVAAQASGLPKDKLLERAQSPEIEKRLRDSTGEFHKMQVTQRPTFVVESEIGDRAVFSGFAKIEPLITTIDAMLADLAFYDSYAAHFGSSPPN